MSAHDILSGLGDSANGLARRFRQDRSVFQREEGPTGGGPGYHGASALEDTGTPVPPAKVEVFPDPLTSMGELLVRLQARRGESVVWDGVAHANSEQSISDACEELALATDVPLSEVEYTVAQIITDEGVRWMGSRGQAGSEGDGFLADVVDSAAFDQAAYRQDWLIKSVLVKGQPCILGGPKKTLKTSIVTDLAVSLGSGGKFLGQFDVP